VHIHYNIIITVMSLEEQHEKQLALWERINFEDYSRKQQIVEESSVEFKVRLTMIFHLYFSSKVYFVNNSVCIIV